MSAAGRSQPEATARRAMGTRGAGIGVGGVPLMSELLGIVRFKFHEGKVEEFKRLSAQAMEIVRAQDTGTLQYDTYFNDDESEAVVIERFRDSRGVDRARGARRGAHGADHRDGFGVGGAAGRVEPGAASEDDWRRPSALQALQVDVSDSRCHETPLRAGLSANAGTISSAPRRRPGRRRRPP